MRPLIRPSVPLRQLFLVAMPARLLLAALTGMYWWHLYSSGKDLRQATLDNAIYRAHQVNSAVSEAVSMLFFNADEASQNLVEFYKQNSIEQFSKQAEVLTHRFPEGSLLQLAVIGPDGFLKFSNLGTDTKIFLGDREHFKVHLEKPSGELFISKPLMGKVSKKWSIQFSRRIEHNGKFLGVLVLSISPEYLFRTLEKLTRGSQDVIVIIRNTGEIMARSRDLEKAMTALKSAEARPYVNSAPGDSGYYQASSRVDQVERMFHWHHLTDYPAIVMLGLDMEALIHHLEKRLQAAPVNQERLAVLFIDLDGFKQINDRYGHPAGDLVLRTAALRLKACARNSDLVARLGGDEFVIVCNDLRKSDDVQLLIARIQEAMRNPIELDHHPLHVGASTGLALYPDNGQTPESLLAAADEAMYRNKAQRKAQKMVANA